MSEMWFLRLIKNWTLSTCGLKLYHLEKVCFSGRLALLYPFYRNCAYLGNEMSQNTFLSCCLCRQSEKVKPCFPHSGCNPIRGFMLWNYPTKGNRLTVFRLLFCAFARIIRYAYRRNKILAKIPIRSNSIIMAKSYAGP